MSDYITPVFTAIRFADGRVYRVTRLDDGPIPSPGMPGVRRTKGHTTSGLSVSANGVEDHGSIRASGRVRMPGQTIARHHMVGRVPGIVNPLPRVGPGVWQGVGTQTWGRGINR